MFASRSGAAGGFARRVGGSEHTLRVWWPFLTVLADRAAGTDSRLLAATGLVGTSVHTCVTVVGEVVPFYFFLKKPLCLAWILIQSAFCFFLPPGMILKTITVNYPLQKNISETSTTVLMSFSVIKQSLMILDSWLHYQTE